ncbi:helix-turn-helix domain-containing protein [Paenibacillus sp. HJGM_3]|uniref:helix-turn-helix domain-containing protein n=1 Tax=Paenibacillus sp. HJGM_3 TaxID=3379816 RepID=UPI0038599CCD
MSIFSERLKWIREKNNVSQKDVAKALGISQQGYSKIELGQREPNLETLHQIRRVFDESLDFLIGFFIEDNHADDLYEMYHEIRVEREDIEDRILSIEEYLSDSKGNTESTLKILMENRDILRKTKVKEELALENYVEYLKTIPGVPDQYHTKEYWVNSFKEKVDKRNKFSNEFYEKIDSLGTE